MDICADRKGQGSESGRGREEEKREGERINEREREENRIFIKVTMNTKLENSESLLLHAMAEQLWMTLKCGAHLTSTEEQQLSLHRPISQAIKFGCSRDFGKARHALVYFFFLYFKL